MVAAKYIDAYNKNIAGDIATEKILAAINHTHHQTHFPQKNPTHRSTMPWSFFSKKRKAAECQRQNTKPLTNLVCTHAKVKRDSNTIESSTCNDPSISKGKLPKKPNPEADPCLDATLPLFRSLLRDSSDLSRETPSLSRDIVLPLGLYISSSPLLRHHSV